MASFQPSGTVLCHARPGTHRRSNISIRLLASIAPATRWGVRGRVGDRFLMGATAGARPSTWKASSTTRPPDSCPPPSPTSVPTTLIRLRLAAGSATASSDLRPPARESTTLTSTREYAQPVRAPRGLTDAEHPPARDLIYRLRSRRRSSGRDAPPPVRLLGSGSISAS